MFSKSSITWVECFDWRSHHSNGIKILNWIFLLSWNKKQPHLQGAMIKNSYNNRLLLYCIIVMLELLVEPWPKIIEDFFASTPFSCKYFSTVDLWAFNPVIKNRKISIKAFNLFLIFWMQNIRTSETAPMHPRPLTKASLLPVIIRETKIRHLALFSLV